MSSALNSICLNANGLASVIESEALLALFSTFTNPKFKKALRASETASVLGTGLDELMRHHPSLRPIGVAAAADLLKRIALLGGVEITEEKPVEAPEATPAQPAAEGSTSQEQPTSEGAAAPQASEGASRETGGEIGEGVVSSPDTIPPTVVPTETTPAPTTTETPAEGSSASPSAAPVEEAKPQAEPSVPKFVAPELQKEINTSTLEAYISNTAALFETLFVNNEHANAFVKSKGIELLLNIFRLPKLPGLLNSSCSHAVSAAFRTLAAHHSADVLKEILGCLAQQFDNLDKVFPTWRDDVGFIKEKGKKMKPLLIITTPPLPIFLP